MLRRIGESINFLYETDNADKVEPIFKDDLAFHDWAKHEVPKVHLQPPSPPKKPKARIRQVLIEKIEEPDQNEFKKPVQAQNNHW